MATVAKYDLVQKLFLLLGAYYAALNRSLANCIFCKIIKGKHV